MENVGNRMNGLSLHYYTVMNWNHKGSATQFNEEDYYKTLGKCRGIEEVIKRHIAIMDFYDPNKNVALMLDEWGTWWDVEPGTNPGHLFQQNSLRDAIVASLTFDIFHKYTDRLKMANIAQVVNVLQSMILTNDKQMTLTPTYHVFRMYNVHQDATFLPMDIQTSTKEVEGGYGTLPMLSGTASRDKQGIIHISLSNVDLQNAQEVTINLQGMNAKKVTGEILTSANINDHNTFDKPDLVKPVVFNGATISGNVLKVKLPAKSIVTLELQ